MIAQPQMQRATTGMLPHDADAERYLAGAILLSGKEAVEQAFSTGLDFRDVYDERIRLVVQAAFELAGASLEIAIDLATVRTALVDSGHIDKIGIPFLAGLTDGLPRVTNIRYYAERVARLARERRAIAAAQNFVAAGLAGNGSEAAGADLQKVLDELNNPKSAKDSWDECTFELCDSSKHITERRWVIESLFPRPGLVCIYAPPGCLKTMLVMDAAMCVALGRPWLEPLPGSAGRAFSTIPCNVWWLDFDQGAAETHLRFNAFRNAYKAPDGLGLRYTVMPDPWLDAGDDSAIDNLVQRAKQMEAGVIVVDNLAVVTGNRKENDAEMAAVMSNWRRVAERADVCVILIHHSGKTKEVRRDGDRLRGHSSIEASFNLALFIDREEHGEELVIRSTKVRGFNVPPFGAVFTYEHLEGTRELGRARFFGKIPDDSGDETTVDEDILRIVSQNPKINRTSLAKMVAESSANGIGIKRVTAELDSLVKARKLTVQIGNRGAQLYDVTSKV
jgi:hypothetical protein